MKCLVTADWYGIGHVVSVAPFFMFIFLAGLVLLIILAGTLFEGIRYWWRMR